MQALLNAVQISFVTTLPMYTVRIRTNCSSTNNNYYYDEYSKKDTCASFQRDYVTDIDLLYR